MLSNDKNIFVYTYNRLTDNGSSSDDYDENTSTISEDQSTKKSTTPIGIKTTGSMSSEKIEPEVSILDEMTTQEIDVDDESSMSTSEFGIPTTETMTSTAEISRLPITKIANNVPEIITLTESSISSRAEPQTTLVSIEDKITTSTSTQMIMGSTVVTSQPLDVFEEDDSDFLSSLFKGLDVNDIHQYEQKLETISSWWTKYQTCIND